MPLHSPQGLVGRDAEIAALTTALSAAGRGLGQMIVLSGEAGMGKSSLAAHVRRAAAADGATVVVGRAVAGPAAVPLRPLTEVMLAATRERPLPDIPSLRSFHPALRRLVAGEAGTAEDTSPVVLGEALLRALSALSTPVGTLLVLEDLQWADPDTLATVGYLADHLGGSRLLAIATVRTTGRDDAATIVRSLTTRHATTVMQLDRLDAGSIARLVAQRLGRQPPAELLRAVEERSDGVPFIIEELLAAGEEVATAGVPVSLAASVDERLAQLGDHARRTLEVAAVLGRSCDLELIAATDDRPVRGVADDLSAAVASQLLDPVVGGEARFRHALTRDAILARLLPAEQAAIAREAAAVVEARAPLGPAELELAARLRQVAREPATAARHLLDAGRSAMRQGALDTATAALEDARELARDDPGVQVEVEAALVECLGLAARSDDAFTVGARLLTHLRERDAPAERVAGAHLLLAHAAATATRWDHARPHLDHARRLADQAADDALTAAIDVLESRVAISTGHLDPAADLATAALAAAERLGLPQVAAEALEVIGRRERLRDLHRAREAFGRQLRVAEAHGLQLLRIRALHELGTIEMLATTDTQRLEAARTLAERAGALALTATIDLQLVGRHALCFQPEPALEAGARCVDLARTLGLDRVLVMGLLQSALAHAVAGRGQEMERLLAQVDQRAGDDPEVAAMSAGHCRAMLALLEERRADALAHLDAAMAAVDRMDGVPPGLFTGLWALLATLGRRDGAAARARIGSSDLGGHVLVADAVTLAEAVALGRDGRGDEAAERVTAAARSLRTRGVAHLRALMLRLVAEAALADGWGEPAAWLREAIAVFADAPHRAVRDVCGAMLREAGAPVPRRSGPVPQALVGFGVTPREFEVLTLVVHHLTNGEIAQRLFLSPRTVEKHIERLLQKTGADDRRALAGLMRESDQGAGT